jgi:hypothetical protein
VCVVLTFWACSVGDPVEFLFSSCALVLQRETSTLYYSVSSMFTTMSCFVCRGFVLFYSFCLRETSTQFEVHFTTVSSLVCRGFVLFLFCALRFEVHFTKVRYGFTTMISFVCRSFVCVMFFVVP